MRGWMGLLMISMINLSCSSIASGKKLKPRSFIWRTYRFCTDKEVADHVGKLCHRYCSKSVLWHNCKETKLLIEDLTDPKVWNSFINADFIIKKRSASL